ncbi:TOBE domain-containing protein [Caballeronia sp. ATUFL_M2_KS44]|uniref:TOBE domain-containing protein n=1 Tax=Caballeronia sp. ATUFL_M2_KS44 TaxID=2921767 RepID=UPI002027F88B|nr:TOBE domain-containing protein [Caballeronia sp. ATUFL_M2_KS44]
MTRTTSPASNDPRDALGLDGSVWLKSGDETLGGAARIALLAAIRETGSITAAAKAVGLSYKAAWDAVDTMNNLAGEPLVTSATGGRGGGGTRLTASALRIIDTYYAVEREHRKFLRRVSEAIEGFEDDWRLIGRLGLKTSARNQLAGKVTKVTRGAVNDEIELGLPGGQTIVAVVTHESTEALGLAEGGDAFALIKASWVMLMEDSPAKLSARNQLRGTVASVTRGAVNAEVTLSLDDSTTVTAIITNHSADTLGLAPGQKAVAVVKASSVIIGVND